MQLLHLLHSVALGKDCLTHGESGTGSEETIPLRWDWSSCWKLKAWHVLAGISVYAPQQEFQKCQQDVRNLFPSLLASNAAFQQGQGRSWSDLQQSQTTYDRVLKPLWSKGCPGSQRRRWCLELDLSLSQSTLVFYRSFKDAETGLIRSCQDTARSGAVTREV